MSTYYNYISTSTSTDYCTDSSVVPKSSSYKTKETEKEKKVSEKVEPILFDIKDLVS